MATAVTTRQPNRLVHEPSPYLRQHAYNPVDWYPWGAAAFERARRENKPIFLSIGYATCHWCHVMERESFENDEIARLLNQYFVCIKLDREERPDLDHIYMTAVQATTGSGGWPMSLWLTPDLKPFYCGTYFAPDSRYGRPGFKELIARIHELWESNHDDLVEQAAQITQALAQQSPPAGNASPTGPLDERPLSLGFEQFQRHYDPDHGGFGTAPKFPRPVTLNFLFRYHARNRHSDPAAAEGIMARDMALHTLRAMADGGIFDHLGGGFHRYSVDARWFVPHFEKMLYDQAQLTTSCLEAWQLTRLPFFANIARRTCDYVLRDLASSDGGFYSAEDADSEGLEGKFYGWTRREIEQAIGDQTRTDIFCRYYGVEPDGNWEPNTNILHTTLTVEQTAQLFRQPTETVRDILADGRAKLFATRAKRVRPLRDEKILTSWNGLMISALAKAHQTLPPVAQASGRSRARANSRDPGPGVYLAAAERAAACLLAQHVKHGELWRTPTVPAVLEDYAFFANALVDLYQADFDPQWLLKALALADTMLERFYDAPNGGFFMTTGGNLEIVVRMKDGYDGAEPSGNSMATLLLLRLVQFANREDYRAAAMQTLDLFYPQLQQNPEIAPQMLCALDLALAPPRQIVIATPPGRAAAPDTKAMLDAVHECFLPNHILLLADSGPAQPALATLVPFLATLQPLAGKATAYLCEDYVCRLPTNDPATLRELLK